ncbi:hypothetical protein [Pseudomonas benzopyrenica]|uniref:hypothetical protein n=1 Tax=Pseudomonas benzopyrenica TaxID=2993566 RepID=UPI003F1686C9
MAITASQIQNLYIAYFGRPAEQAGLDYWSAQADLTVEGLSASFAEQPEYQAVYGDLPREEVVAQLYQNLFGRKAEGNELDYWIASDDISVDRMALALVNGAQSTDRELLDGKTEFATAITAAQGTAADIASVKQAFNDTTTTISFQGTTYTIADFAREVGPISQFYQLAATELNTNGPKPATPAPSSPSAPAPAPSPVPAESEKHSYSVNGEKGLQDETGASVSAALYSPSTSKATIALNNVGSANIALADASALSSLTLAGTVSNSNFSNYLNISEAGTTDTVKTLNLKLSGGDAPITTYISYDMGALTKIDASESSVRLTIGVYLGSKLSELISGSGGDFLHMGSLDRDFSLNTGAGNDYISFSGFGSDVLTSTHKLTITLGDGQDTFSAMTLSNLRGAYDTSTPIGIATAQSNLQAGLVKITDFTAGDMLKFGSEPFTDDGAGFSAGGKFVAQTDAQQKAISTTATLAEALQLAANNATGEDSHARSTAFQYQGNTYVFVDHTLSNTVAVGDGLIELTGYLGKLDATNFSFFEDSDAPNYHIQGFSGLQNAEGKSVTNLSYQAGVTVGSIELREAQEAKNLSLDDARTLTELALTGSSSAAGAQFYISGNAATQLSTLKLAISGGDTTIDASFMSTLTSIDASKSTADLTLVDLTPGSLSALSTIVAGSGDDVVRLGIHPDVFLKSAAPAYANGLSITLGDGADTLQLQSLGNLVGSFAVDDSTEIKTANAALQKSLIKVTDFSAEDKLDVASVYGLKNATFTQQTADQQNAVGKADTLAEALQLAANNAAGADTAVHSTSFQYGGNTYLFVDHSAEQEVAPGDGLIELTGYTGTLDSQNLIIAA